MRLARFAILNQYLHELSPDSHVREARDLLLALILSLSRNQTFNGSFKHLLGECKALPENHYSICNLLSEKLQKKELFDSWQYSLLYLGWRVAMRKKEV